MQEPIDDEHDAIYTSSELMDLAKSLSDDDRISLSKTIWDGEHDHLWFEFLHPKDELRTHPMFDIVQEMFINAYV